MNEVMNICQKSILCNLTVSNIVIILVQSSIADGESFLVIFHVFIFIRNNLSQSSHKKLSQPTLYKQQIQI